MAWSPWLHKAYAAYEHDEKRRHARYAGPDEYLISGDTYRTAIDERRHDTLLVDGDVYSFRLRENYQRPVSVSADITNNVHRSELVSQQKQYFNIPIALSYEFKVDAGAEITSDFCNVGQWHATADDGEESLSPCWSCRIEGEDLVIYTRGPSSTVARYTAALVRDHWYAMDMVCTFSHTAGSLVLSLDGVEVINVTGIPFAYDDLIGPYWQFGIYKRVSPELITVHYRDIVGPDMDIGVELIADGGFADPAYWTTSAPWSVAGGAATKVGGTSGAISRAVALVVGKRYLVEYDLVSVSAGTVTPRFTGGTTVNGTAAGTAGHKHLELVAVTGNNSFSFQGSTSFAGSIDNVSLRQID